MEIYFSQKRDSRSTLGPAIHTLPDQQRDPREAFLVDVARSCWFGRVMKDGIDVILTTSNQNPTFPGEIKTQN